MHKIIVTSPTGSNEKIGQLHASGVIEFESGEISHIQFELSFNRTIKKYVEPKKEEVKEEAAHEASDKPKKKATKK